MYYLKMYVSDHPDYQIIYMLFCLLIFANLYKSPEVKIVNKKLLTEKL